MWWFVALFALSLAASYYFTPKQQGTKPAGIKEISLPTNEAGREIPVLFGTKRMTGPLIAWYGHLRIVPIKKKGGKK